MSRSKSKAKLAAKSRLKRDIEKSAAAKNAFEQIRTRKKFNILGKKAKGDTKRTTQMRSAAVEKRKDTLLVEYKQLKKNNAFVDRRFGEDDESLTQEEKALMRFQKQRLKEMSGSKFTLAEEDEYDDGEGLTHLGQSLNDTLSRMPDSRILDDDEDDGTDLLEQYNFGGGREAGEGSPRHKTKKEIMEEVIAKSKMFKAMKAKQREEDLDETDALDVAWKELAQENLTSEMMRPKGSRAEEREKGKKLVSEEDKKFDSLTRELVFEAKAQAGERTLTKEELADLERQRLEELEKQRVHREKGGDDLEDDFEGINGLGAAPTGGYAARRARMKQKIRQQEEEAGEEEGTSDGDDSGYEDGVTAVERRRQEQAGGDHPLQEQFRDVALELLKRHKMGDTKGILKIGSKSRDASEDESSQTDSSDEGSSEEEEEEEEEEEHEEDDDQSDEKHPFQEQDIQDGEQENDGTLNLTFTPALPESYDDFKRLVDALEPEEIHEMISRVRAYNAAALTEGGRKKMQILYGCILQHFVSLAGQTPIPFGKVDALVSHITEMTPLVPYYSAVLARSRLEKEYDAMKRSLKDPVKRVDAWPSNRMILLSKLFMDIYPVTDKRHQVLTPLGTFLSSSLVLCPIVEPVHAVKGLIVSHLLVHAHARSGRFAPEALCFATGLLKCFTGYISFEFGDSENLQWMKTFQRSQFKSRKGYSVGLNLEDCLHGSQDFASQSFCNSLLNATLELIKSISSSVYVEAFEELFSPAMLLLEELSAHASSKPCYLDPELLASAQRLADELKDTSDEISRKRKPVYLSSISKAPAVKQYNPRFEESYAKGKDYDPDRERAEERRLKRQIRKEERGAIRELRKDAVFMAGVRDQEKHRLQTRLDNSAKRAMSFLQQQESDFKSGGQGGMWKKKKKK